MILEAQVEATIGLLELKLRESENDLSIIRDIGNDEMIVKYYEGKVHSCREAVAIVKDLLNDSPAIDYIQECKAIAAGGEHE